PLHDALPSLPHPCPRCGDLDRVLAPAWGDDHPELGRPVMTKLTHLAAMSAAMAIAMQDRDSDPMEFNEADAFIMAPPNPYDFDFGTRADRRYSARSSDGNGKASGKKSRSKDARAARRITRQSRR